MTGGTAEDPKKSTTYRVLVVVVSILSILIILALAAIVAGGMRLFGHHAGSPGTMSFTTSQLSTQLPVGAKITSIETSGNRVVIGLHTPAGDEVDIFDTDTGRPVARIKAAAAPK